MQSFKAQLLNPIRPGNMWSFDANNHFMMILKNVLMWLEMLSRNVHIACKSFYMAPIVTTPFFQVLELIYCLYKVQNLIIAKSK